MRRGYQISQVETAHRKRTAVSSLLIFIAIPAVIILGFTLFNDRKYILVSWMILAMTVAPFFMVFEKRKPKAREIVLIAMMCALTLCVQLLCRMTIAIRAGTAIIIASGIALGPEAGFLIGALSRFVLNFYEGQGPWTPWQMFSFGIIGFLAGLLFRSPGKRSGSRKKEWRHKILLCIYGGLSTLIIYGFFMDTASVTMVGQDLSWQAFAASYATGFPFNVIHGTSTVIFLFFLTIPMERKLDRIRKKYGILEV